MKLFPGHIVDRPLDIELDTCSLNQTQNKKNLIRIFS